MTLNEVMKETADAIREKTGKSELIKPVDFASEIKGITSGGESGSNVEYWDITAFPESVYELAPFATLLKYTKSGKMYIESIYNLSRSNITPIGIAIDTSLEHLNNATIETVGEIFKVLVDTPFDTFGWVRLTKEQFYSLD